MVPLSAESTAFPSPFAAAKRLMPLTASPAGFFTPNLRRPSSAVVDYIRRLASAGEPIIERRGAPRMAVTFAARAVMLDVAMQPAGDELTVIVRNISATGMGLLSNTRIDGPYLALELAADGGDTLLVTIAVRRCQPIGPCFDIGGRFVPRPAKASND
ncbi:MAG TPA: PilZ domain-containing protein [Pirellulales bacterium]|jgi:hypothetical protein|nr:PilZ domain-containing protein [Pirellulales bacterium]